MRTLLSVVFTLILFNELAGQSPSGEAKEIRIGYGFLSDVRIIAAFAETYSIIGSGISGEPLSTDYSTAGPLIFRYDALRSRKISLGPEVNFVQLKKTAVYSSGQVVVDRFVFVNFSARFDYRYVNKENVRMYSGLALGPSYIFDKGSASTRDESGFFISYQINFFGISFGREWAGYAEFGFGRNGLLSLGISKQL